MESFAESLNRLRDIHETEILGLQSKLLELNAERCRDAQRAEELSAKNQQLREQQRVLKENVRALENRLRAGLCDRCVVTQELAKKKQREFEGSLLQSLQHVFILTNEMSRLQEENNGLKKEVKRLRGPGDRPQAPSREGPSSLPSPPSPSAWKTVAETPDRGSPESEDEHPEKLSGYRASPGARLSPSASGPEAPRSSDMSPQRISNQLHGTIAVVRPGSWAPQPTRGTPPVSQACSGPPSPPADSFLQPPAGTYVSLSCSGRTGHLCLLDPHLALRLHSPPDGPKAQGPKAGADETWEDPSNSPTTLPRNPQLEGALQLLLARQLRVRGLEGGARSRRPPTPESPEDKVPGTAMQQGLPPRSPSPGCPPRKETSAVGDWLPDKPLDLSEWGRIRGVLKPTSPSNASPEPRLAANIPGQLRLWALSNGGTQREEGQKEHLTPQGHPHQSPGSPMNQPSPEGTGEEPRGRPRTPHHQQRPDASPTDHEAKGQRPELEKQEEPDPPGSEVAMEETMEGGLNSCEDPRLGLPPKRKQNSEACSEPSKKPAPGRSTWVPPTTTGPCSPSGKTQLQAGSAAQT